MTQRHRQSFEEAHREIAQAKARRSSSLYLRGLRLRNLPSEIGELHWLEALDVQENELESLPPEVGNLQQLDALYCWKNRLLGLPDEFSNLRSLRFANFDNNRLRQLPPGLDRLTKLREFKLNYNQLETLPVGVGGLPAGCTLELDGNPLQEPLPTLLAQGRHALRTYLASLDDSVRQYEAKVLVVGEGEVGKSSLLAALRGERFVENRPTTHGIEIERLAIPHPTIDTTIQLNTWDFGGQEIYRITHQFFFGRRCLYILAWNPRQGREANEVEGWIKRIRLRVGDEARIIIVSTHADIRRPELDYPALRQYFGPILEANIEVDSLSGNGIGELTRQLSLSSSTLPQMGELLNKNWADARDKVLSFGQPHATYAEFLDTCLAHDMDESEAGVLAVLLHDLGHIVHYADDDGLRDIVVLQAEWLTKAIGYVLEDSRTRDDGGVLDHQRLRDIWTEELGYPTRYHPYFLRLMEKFDVSYRLPERDASLVGQLVPYSRPELAAPVEHAPDRVLELVCIMQEEAPGLIAWLTVRNHRFSMGNHWRRGVFLRHARYQSVGLFELLDERTLTLNVRAPSPDYFFSILRDSLEELIAGRWPGLDYDVFVPCRQVPEGNKCRGRFAYRLLQKYRERDRSEIDCAECFTPHNVNEMLTGFGLTGNPISQALDKFRESYSEIGAGLKRIEVYAAESAGHVRAALRAIASESADSPRLFSLRLKDASMLSRMSFWNETLMLTLWCEHPGSEHPCRDGDYELKIGKQWFTEAMPYIKLILKTLKVLVPMATGASTEFLPKELGDAMKERLRLMDSMVKLVADTNPKTAPSQLESGSITQAEGAGLRAIRALLFDLDSARRWGDLRRKLTPSGDYVWVCPDHYQIYDPGLPELPA